MTLRRLLGIAGFVAALLIFYLVLVLLDVLPNPLGGRAEPPLVVATSEPIPPSVAEDLGFALDLGVRQVIAPLVRIRQALAGYYRVPVLLTVGTQEVQLHWTFEPGDGLGAAIKALENTKYSAQKNADGVLSIQSN